MTLADVHKMLSEIESAKGDDEHAHALEDQLHQAVLEHFADQGDHLAAAALETRKILFTRWYA